ncbi:AraC family transcriptional regulator [Embleya scabrispora]|uniref:AraC family transcriptional regulator n=1 Tax=Embleya scabrispora TaxID=159449 RepID=UPI00117EC1C6|nr:AraC family transcriptional regulator [Embleya scabrispora]
MLDGTVSARMGRFMVDFARRAGMPPERLGRLPGLGAEILADEFVRVPTSAALVLWEEIIAGSPDPDAGLRAAAMAPLGSFGVWDYLFTSGATLAESLNSVGGYVTVIGDPQAERISVVDDGRLLILSHSTGPAGADVVAAVEQFAAVLFTRRATEALHRPVAPVRVTFRHRAPTGTGTDALTELLGTRNIDFDAPANTITFLADDAHAPLPHTQPGLHEVLRNHAELVIAAARPVLNWHAVFRIALHAAIHNADLSLATVARRMATTPRTLQRRLAEHGTTWRDEVQAVREQLALELLRDGTIPLRAVAARAGFSDPRTLRRAMHRWQGAPPADVRRSLTIPT